MHCRSSYSFLTTLALISLFISTPIAQADFLKSSLPLVPICSIQGNTFSSPLEGQRVRTRGVVFADFDESPKRGFFIQEENCDDDASTSDGLFIYIGNLSDVVSKGDYVEVSGWVKEYNGLTEISADIDDVSILPQEKSLPAPRELNPPFEESAAVAFLESLEGMYVHMEQAIVVGPTNRWGETWVVNANLGIERAFQGEAQGNGEIICVDDGGTTAIAPAARVGDTLEGLLGVLDVSSNVFRLQLLSTPLFMPNPALFQPFISGDGISIATFNVENLFDTLNDPDKSDQVLSQEAYQRKLQKLAKAIAEGLGQPTILALQEVENSSVLEDLLAQPEISLDYGIAWIDGPDERGIDIALLYRSDWVEVLEVEQLQGCTSLVDGLGPDGNGDVLNPSNALTCDSDGDGNLDGNRLFSRPPLNILLRIQGKAQDAWNLRLIVNHWKSKTEDTPEVKYTLLRRVEEAEFVARLVRDILATQSDAHLVVLGDLNDYPDSQAVMILQASSLYNIVNRLPLQERYTYIHQGSSQVLDYILLSPSLNNQIVTIHSIHMNADYPDIYAEQADSLHRSSDHDPLVMQLSLAEAFSYLPLVALDTR
jgi:predicted extracellular nuclease